MKKAAFRVKNMISLVAETVANRAERLGLKPRELKRFIKFAVVGVIGAVVDFGIFNLLRPVFLNLAAPDQTWLAIPTTTIAVTMASAISFIAAIVSNFTWNRYWTYPDSRSKSFRRQFTQFFVVSVIGIAIRVPIVAVTHFWFEDLLLWIWPAMEADLAVLLGDNLAVALAVGLVMFWNFFVNRYWTYNDVD